MHAPLAAQVAQAARDLLQPALPVMLKTIAPHLLILLAPASTDSLKKAQQNVKPAVTPASPAAQQLPAVPVHCRMHVFSLEVRASAQVVPMIQVHPPAKHAAPPAQLATDLQLTAFPATQVPSVSCQTTDASVTPATLTTEHQPVLLALLAAWLATQQPAIAATNQMVMC